MTFQTNQPDITKLLPEDIERINRIANLQKTSLEIAIQQRIEHIEQMAAAYFAKTDIPPDEVELVEEHLGLRIVWYFRRKGSED